MTMINMANPREVIVVDPRPLPPWGRLFLQSRSTPRRGRNTPSTRSLNRRFVESSEYSLRRMTFLPQARSCMSLPASVVQSPTWMRLTRHSALVRSCSAVASILKSRRRGSLTEVEIFGVFPRHRILCSGRDQFDPPTTTWSPAPANGRSRCSPQRSPASKFSGLLWCVAEEERDGSRISDRPSTGPSKSTTADCGERGAEYHGRSRTDVLQNPGFRGWPEPRGRGVRGLNHDVRLDR